MACATLKRSLEWDPLNGPSNGGSPSRPSKKRCLNNVYSKSIPPKDPSPFGEVKPKITPEYIAATIKEEMKRLQNRKQLHYVSPGAPSTSTSAESTSECSSTESLPSLLSSKVGLMSPSRRDQPLFTFRQVGIICERLMKERESQMREEYDSVLNTKLAEQYDTFVKFTYDQIQKRYETGTLPSYLS